MGENMNKPVAYCVTKDNHIECLCFNKGYAQKHADRCKNAQVTPLYTHPVKELTDEEIAKVVHELNQKANTPERWVTAMQIGAETIIHLRDELRKAQDR